MAQAPPAKPAPEAFVVSAIAGELSMTPAIAIPTAAAWRVSDW
jgi:hypothetical protein